MLLLPNINILVPNSKHMWAMWGNVSKEKVIAYKKMTKKGTPLIENHRIFFQNLCIILVQPQEMFDCHKNDNLNQTIFGHGNQS
jgi:hypothetical protein